MFSFFSGNCKHDPNVFYYICGCFTTSKRKSITDIVRKGILCLFWYEIG